MSWISVKERLPQSGYGVIVLENGRAGYGYLRTLPENYQGRAGRWRVGMDAHFTNNVTHWQPLPAPPEAVDE